MDIQFLKKLRMLALIEGVSTLILFGIAMPLKYFGDMPVAVKVAGSIHGALFVSLAIMCLMAINKVPIGLRLGVIVIVGAVLPFGPFVVDKRLKKIELVTSKNK